MGPRYSIAYDGTRYHVLLDETIYEGRPEWRWVSAHGTRRAALETLPRFARRGALS